MTYDDKLAARVRKATATLDGITEKKMFGGLSFLLEGKMLCGVVDHDLMVRVGPGYEASLALPHVRPMDFTGRPLAGFVYVAASGVRTDAAVASWVERARQFVGPLPAKARKPARSRRT